MFRQDGIPVRATLSVSFSQYMTESDLKASPTHSPDKTRAYTITQGDNLWGIAAKMYGDPAFWRPIADRNAIENPRILKAGKIIAIPPLEK
jgi:nucleoid-associated protein YgaU